jgi:hypothetical protein
MRLVDRRLEDYLRQAKGSLRLALRWPWLQAPPGRHRQAFDGLLPAGPMQEQSEAVGGKPSEVRRVSATFANVLRPFDSSAAAPRARTGAPIRAKSPRMPPAGASTPTEPLHNPVCPQPGLPSSATRGASHRKHEAELHVLDAQDSRLPQRRPR